MFTYDIVHLLTSTEEKAWCLRVWCDLTLRGWLAK